MSDDCIETTWNLEDESSKVGWSLGPCNSVSKNIYPGTQYFQKCCTLRNEVTLTCQNDGRSFYTNEYGKDWRGGFLTVQEHRFCDVFYERTRIRLNKKGK